MDSKLFDYNADFGIVQKWHYDESTDTAIIESVQDHTAIVEANRNKFNRMDERSDWKGDMHHVATIPLVLIQELKQKGILDDQVALKKWLNDPENRFFRTRPGQV